LTDPQLTDADLVAVTSHEMRTPLAAINGFTETLIRRRHEFTDDEIGDFLGIIATQTGRLMRMVDDLLLISRLQNGTMPIDPEPLLLVPFLEEVAGSVDDEARIHVRISTDLPASLQVDPLRLRQILTNLLQNALKYSGAQERVTLIADAHGDDVVIDVIDRGPGIPSEEHALIFEPFYRVAGTGGDDGAGLGLAITRHLANAMGGHVQVMSAPGEGATFRVTIPTRAR
jgi:two-component system sensor histidine kinase KdpD